MMWSTASSGGNEALLFKRLLRRIEPKSGERGAQEKIERLVV